MEDKLQLKFDPHTIEHLGIRMYSQLPYALAELVANAYDAGAENVEINMYDTPTDKKRIEIIDDGDGMSYKEVSNKFLVIGRKRRDYDDGRENSKGRKITGKKGLGKLALFGIGKKIVIETTRIGESKKTCFELNWEKILEEASGVYQPDHKFEEKENSNEKGTKITLTKLSRVTDFDLRSTAVSLSKLFNCFDADFRIKIAQNGGEPILLTRELRYEGIEKEFEWDIHNIANNIEYQYENKEKIQGKIISSKKPMKQELRGITLYVNGRLANVPSFFGVSEAGHTFSYISGWIDADFLDEYDKDLISTDRQSLSWDMQEAEELQVFLQKIIRYLVNDWSAKRREAKEKANSNRAGINTHEWFEKVPDTIRPKLENVINTISAKPEIDDEDFSIVVHKMHDLIPPYTYYHYRLLHDQVQDASKIHYEGKDYYAAFQEAMKRYKNAVKQKSGVEATEDLKIVTDAFGRGDKPLETTAKYKLRPNGDSFSSATLENIEDGQMTLSRGVVQGGRNIVSHEEHIDLKESGLFTEKDCLDMLSILSHLFKRLDESIKRNNE